MIKQLPDRIQKKIEVQENGCWYWTAHTHGGYGKIAWEGRPKQAHRVVYELLVEPIPNDPNLVIDHLCRIRNCVNPSHLEIVTRSVNVQRGRAGSLQPTTTYCINGHEYIEDNTYTDKKGVKICKTCNKIRYQERTQRIRTLIESKELYTERS